MALRCRECLSVKTVFSISPEGNCQKLNIAKDGPGSREQKQEARDNSRQEKRKSENEKKTLDFLYWMIYNIRVLSRTELAGL